MYQSHYDLKLKPFQISVDPRFLWLGGKQKEALSTLKNGILKNKGFLLLTGEAGSGKTVLISQLVKMLDIDMIVATIPDPDLESLDFFKLLAEGFGFKEPFKSKGGFLIQLREFLLKSYENQQRVLLIIDESQRLGQKLLEEIRLLSHIELHDRKLINIFFVGRTEFLDIISDPRNGAVAQRIALRYKLAPWDEKETGDYIHHCLSVAGTEKEIFTIEAIHEIHAFSKGIPRLINVICDHALLMGYSRGTRKIDTDIVKACASEMRISVKNSKNVHELQTSVNEIKQQQLRAIGGGIFKPLAGKVDNSVRPFPKPVPLVQAKKPTAAAKPIETIGPEDEPKNRSILMPIISICFALLLLGAVVYGLVKLRPSETPQWDVEELTPKKYEDTLQQQKESLEAKLASGEIDETDIVAESEENAGSGDTVTDAQTAGQDQIQDTDMLTVTDLPAEGEAASVVTESSPVNTAPTYSPGEIVRIYFDLNSNEISSEDLRKLDGIAAYLKVNPAGRVFVKGYTDARGARSYNISVSQFRANIVQSYLIGKGAPKSRIQTFALGPENPIARNDTAEGRRKNRRVEIEFAQSPANTDQN